MAWVEIVPPEAATGPLKRLYDRRQGMPEVATAFSLRPELMDIRLRFQDEMTFGGSGLGRYREELIAVCISAICRCRY